MINTFFKGIFMKKNVVFAALLVACIASTLSFYAGHAFASDKPVQHLQLPDVTSLSEAKQVFEDTTAELQSKHKLDANELGQIHITTYSLEKAVAYFADNTQGDQQVRAKKMAEVVELVHIASENNRADEARTYLQEYSNLAAAFAETLAETPVEKP